MRTLTRSAPSLLCAAEKVLLITGQIEGQVVKINSNMTGPLTQSSCVLSSFISIKAGSNISQKPFFGAKNAAMRLIPSSSQPM